MVDLSVENVSAQQGGQCPSCLKPYIYDDLVNIYYCEECDTILAKLPGGKSYMLLGDTGTGKSVLMSKLLDLLLKHGRACVYAAFDEPPSQVREFMDKYVSNLREYETKGLITFLDCYSCIAGIPSEEKYFIRSPGDLNELNLVLTQLTNKVSEIGVPVVCIDSITKAFIHSESELVTRFVATSGAKLKLKKGSFVFTLSTGTVSSEVQKRLEQLVDGLIELRIIQSEGRQQREFRISKIRGVPYYENWLPFFIGKSSIFLSIPSEEEERRRFNTIFKMINEA